MTTHLQNFMRAASRDDALRVTICVDFDSGEAGKPMFCAMLGDNVETIRLPDLRVEACAHADTLEGAVEALSEYVRIDGEARERAGQQDGHKMPAGYSEIMDALDNVEGIDFQDGRDGNEYVALMEAIIAECQKRAAIAEANSAIDMRDALDGAK